MVQSTVTNTISALKKADLSSNDVARIMVAALKKIERFEPRDVALCTGALLDKLRAIPMHDTIYTDPQNPQRMYIRGRLVKDPEIQRRIGEQAILLQRNIVRKLVREKVEFMAAQIAIHKSTDLWDIVFSKAALWFKQEEDKVITALAGEDEAES